MCAGSPSGSDVRGGNGKTSSKYAGESGCNSNTSGPSTPGSQTRFHRVSHNTKRKKSARRDSDGRVEARDVHR